jgi:hypothetical protein
MAPFLTLRNKFQAVDKAIQDQWKKYTCVFGPTPEEDAEYTYEYLGEYLKQHPTSTRLYRKYVSKRDKSPERSVKQ